MNYVTSTTIDYLQFVQDKNSNLEPTLKIYLIQYSIIVSHVICMVTLNSSSASIAIFTCLHPFVCVYPYDQIACLEDDVTMLMVSSDWLVGMMYPNDKQYDIFGSSSGELMKCRVSFCT